MQGILKSAMINKVTIDFNMLGTLMKDIIVDNLDNTSIVTLY